MNSGLNSMNLGRSMIKEPPSGIRYIIIIMMMINAEGFG